jgi:hypothetical protein
MLAQKIALETDQCGALAVARQFLVPCRRHWPTFGGDDVTHRLFKVSFLRDCRTFNVAAPLSLLRNAFFAAEERFTWGHPAHR